MIVTLVVPIVSYLLLYHSNNGLVTRKDYVLFLVFQKFLWPFAQVLAHELLFV